MSVTPRRSNRLSRNPLVVRNPHKKSPSEVHTWTSDPIYSRPSIQDDFLDDEWEQARGDDDDEDADGRNLMTDFYDGFSVSGKKIAGKFVRFTRGTKKGRPKNKAKANDEEERYKIGDTVLVTSVNRLPSVGVIVGMWENRWENEDGEETQKMRVKIHWFLRPTELAGIRAKREHVINEIYYSLNQFEIVYPNNILAHCIVSSVPPADTDEAIDSKGIGSSPSKRSLWVYEEELQDDDGTERYYCHSAINSQRGLFYEFEWEGHREVALGGDGEVEGDVWDVLVDDGMERRRKGKEKQANIKTTGPTRPKKKRKKEDSEEDQSETEDFTESEDGGSEDEYASQTSDDEEDDEAGPSDSDSPADEDSDVSEDILGEPRTPSKKRKRPTVARTYSKSPSKSTRTPSKRTATTATPTTTPRKPTTKRRQPVAPTPQSRKSIATRKLKRKQKSLRVRPPPPLTSHLQLENMPTNPWLRAMHVLHVGARPDVLPCREEEYAKCLRAVEELVEEGSGGCVYISGVPGTGKTATVHAIVRELKRMAEETETNPFTYVEINGLKIPDPTAAYSLLWEAVSGHDVANEGHMKISAKESLKCLSRHFSAGGAGAGASGRGRGPRGRGGPGGHACVVLMDELDQLVTTKQDVVYNFFNWPTLVGSKLIVLAVANTMDLPERVMSGRVRSRLGMIRINFQPYTTPQLEKIVQTRLQSARDGLEGKDKEQIVISSDGIKFAAMKVSSISGDARRVLDICRRTVELVQPLKRTAKTDDVKDVIKVMQNSPTAAYLHDCSLHERMMLAALLKVIKREGIEEVRWGDVQHQHLIYMNVLTGADDPMRKPTSGELNMVLESLAASRAMLIEDGLAASRKAEGDRKVILNLEQGEVERILSGFGSRWKNALSG